MECVIKTRGERNKIYIYRLIEIKRGMYMDNIIQVML